MSHVCYIPGMTNQTPEADKDLLDELMGKDSKISKSTTELPDGPLPPVPDPNADLVIKPEAPKSPVQSLDEVHATSQGGDGYTLTIAGQAYTFDGKVKVNKNYEVVVKVTKLEGVLTTLRKPSRNGGESFLDATVRKVIGDGFRGVRTYHIVSAIPRNPSKTAAPDNLQFMSLEQLKAVATERAAGFIKLSDYGDDVVALRETLMDFFQNDRKNFAAREKQRSADILERRELEKLNA